MSLSFSVEVIAVVSESAVPFAFFTLTYRCSRMELTVLCDVPRSSEATGEED